MCFLFFWLFVVYYVGGTSSCFFCLLQQQQRRKRRPSCLYSSYCNWDFMYVDTHEVLFNPLQACEFICMDMRGGGRNVHIFHFQCHFCFKYPNCGHFLTRRHCSSPSLAQNAFCKEKMMNETQRQNI